jgi:hypothetical protein
MLKIVHGFVCKDTVALARWMLDESLAGNIRGAAVCVKMDDARDEVRFTGAYGTARPHNAVCAAAHMYWVASEHARNATVRNEG